MDFYCRLINREYPLERDYIPDDLIPCDFPFAPRNTRRNGCCEAPRPRPPKRSLNTENPLAAVFTGSPDTALMPGSRKFMRNGWLRPVSCTPPGTSPGLGKANTRAVWRWISPVPP